MQLTVDIQYKQLIDIIRHLPPNQLAMIKSELENTVAENSAVTLKTDFQEFLLKGPVMSNVQYIAFKENRKTFNQWRSK